MRQLSGGALFTLLALVPAALVAADRAYEQQIEAFQAKREAGLRADGSWLTVVGLHWLKPGLTSFGSAASSTIRLPEHSAPASGGVLRLEDERVTATLVEGTNATVDGVPVKQVEMRSDKDGPPAVLRLGTVTLHIIDRGGRLGVRVKDNKSAKRAAFAGLHWFPVDERFRIDARWVPLSPHGTIPIADVTGAVSNMESPGFAEFDWNGSRRRLQAVVEGPDATELFFIFKDETAGRKTYGAGRFLYAALPKDGLVTLDFNKAYSPPCAFTAFATCPLPPRQNRLPFPIEAGELDPH